MSAPDRGPYDAQKDAGRKPVDVLPFFGINKYWAAACLIPFGTIALLWWMGLKLQELEKR